MHGKTLSVRVLQRSEGEARATVVVSGKVSKLAVKRNRLKRRIRALLATKLPHLQTGVSVVVFAKKEALEAHTKEIDTDLNKLLIASKLYPRPHSVGSEKRG